MKPFLKHLLAPEYPKIFAIVSMWIATPLLGLCTIVYVQNALTQPVTDTFPIGLSAFGVTAALSGISFSMVKAYENPATARYAGEKFLHSSILLIQSLIILYLRDTAIDSEWIKTWPHLLLPIKMFASGILSLVTIVAAATWYYGYSELNVFLWKRWEQNIEASNAGMKDKETVVPLKANGIPTQTSSEESTPT
jgi:hypothetical protein